MPLQWRGPRISLGSKEGAMARIDGVAPVALLTGFEPYGGRGVNPATEVVTRLDGAEIEGVRVAGRVLPVSFGALRSRIHELMQKVAPVVVVSLGLWPGEPTIRLERVALNLADFEIPDNDGALLRDDVVAAAAPTAIASTLPLRAIEGALLRAGIPARLSTTAGTFLCNTTMYTFLHTEPAGRGVPCGFVHLPYLPEQVAALLQDLRKEQVLELHQRADLASMSLATMVEAVRIVLGVSLATAA
ncbi:MAG: pyroglutamyl-peptidase I [Candidatus Rokuibacteriota bacterium]|nr:MAG: pyroglutamyl-peptidase I [Candidatus Rokubacteria bacterium]